MNGKFLCSGLSATGIVCTVVTGITRLIMWDWSDGRDLEALTHNLAGRPMTFTLTGTFDPAQPLIQDAISTAANH